MLPKVVIFDVGGTLIKNIDFNFQNGLKFLYDEIFDIKDSFEDFVKMNEERHNEVEIARRNNYEISFYSIYHYFSFLFPKKTNLSFDEIELEFSNRIYHIEAIEGTLEFINCLENKNIKLYVLSNTLFSTKVINDELRRVGLYDHFLDTLGTGDYGFRKPSKTIFNLYLKKLKDYSPSDIAYIGNDYELDIVTPISLGMQAYFKGEKMEEHDDYLEFDNYHNLLEWFKKNG